MKNKLSKGLSLSVNPKHSISERFKAFTRGFCHFLKKFDSERNTLFSVILGFIPRIHAEQNSMDTRDTPEYDKCTIFKGLGVVCQYAALLERRVQSSTRVRKAQAVTRQTNPIGRSMIEMLGVLAIIGVLSVGGIAGYSKAMETYKINKLKQAITEIVTNTRTLYAQQNPQNKYQGLDYSTAKNAGILTVDLHNSDIYPSLSGNYYNSYKTFLIELSWISEKECVALATADWGTTSSTGFYSLAISDYSHNYEEVIGCETTGENNFGSGNKTYIARSGQLPLSPAIAAKYCALNSAKGFDYNQGHNSFISLQFQ